MLSIYLAYIYAIYPSISSLGCPLTHLWGWPDSQRSSRTSAYGVIPGPHAWASDPCEWPGKYTTPADWHDVNQARLDCQNCTDTLILCDSQLAWDTGQIQSFWLPIVQHQSLGLSIEQVLALVHLRYEHGAVSSLQHPRVVRMAAGILCPVNQSSLLSRVVTHPFWKLHSTCLSALLRWLLLSLPGTLRQLLYNVIRSFLHISSFASNWCNVVLSLVGLKLCQGKAVIPYMNIMAHPTPSMAPLTGVNE